MFDVDELRRAIEALICEYPDLAEDEMLRADMLDGETDIKAVLAELFEATDDNRSMIAALTDRVHQLTTRRTRFTRRVEFLRELMLKILQSADLKKVELAEVTLSQRRTPPQIVGEIDPDMLPDDLVVIERKPDRAAIREALLANRELPGLALSNAPPGLTINTK